MPVSRDLTDHAGCDRVIIRLNDLLAEVAQERDSLRAALKAMLATARGRSRELRRLDMWEGANENDTFVSTLEALMRGIPEGRLGMCPACFGTREIQQNPPEPPRACELCRGTGKWFISAARGS